MNCKNNSMVQRGDIFYAALGETVGSEQSGTRPVLVIQNDIGNKYSPTVIVTVLTSKTNKKYLPTHVAVDVKHGVSIMCCTKYSRWLWMTITSGRTRQTEC